MQKIEPIMRANVLALATAYAKHRGMKFPYLSKQVHSDPRWLDNLAAKRGTISARKYDEAIAWFFDKWPDDLKMPRLREFPPAPKRASTDG
jgi:hypothetical protein